MSKKSIVIDTNILVYYYKNDTDFYKVSASILENKEYNLFITTKSISEFFAVLTKYKIAWEKILIIFKDLQKNVTILYPNNKSLNKLTKVCEKYKPHRNQVFDMEIVSIMLAHKLDTIATFNHKDFKNIKEIHVLNECLFKNKSLL